MDYTPKVFTRENPCTKIHIHNCFYAGGQYPDKPVIEAKTFIGENCPKYLTREGFATVVTRRGVDYYHLTPEGDSWLRQGIIRYLTLHPDRINDCLHPPPGFTVPRRGAIAPSPAIGQVMRRRT